MTPYATITNRTMENLNYIQLMEQAETCTDRKQAIKLINMATREREKQTKLRMNLFSTNDE